MKKHLSLRTEEKPSRSIVKSLSYRVFGTLTTVLAIWVTTRQWSLSIGAGMIDFFSKIALFYFHERTWNLIGWGKKEITPVVIWFTGLSGAGKTTLSQKLFEKMQEKGLSVDLLDGDSVRSFFKDTGFSRSERIRHLTIMGFVAAKLEKNGTFVLASFITPYEEARNQIRKLCSNYLEVHVRTSLSVCEFRDPKGLYKKARSGEIQNFTGISDVFETPNHSDIVIDTDQKTIDAAFEELITRLKEKSPSLKRLLS